MKFLFRSGETFRNLGNKRKTFVEKPNKCTRKLRCKIVDVIHIKRLDKETRNESQSDLSCQ